MKKILFAFVLLRIAITFSFFSYGNSLETNFKNPPADVRIGVYWYWMNNNISKEGVVKDLHAMKKAGITRAFIGNIGSETQFGEGRVKIFTDEWWDILHTALKTATGLDIELGIFNCPGWSQSGGPWIKPEQAMRYLAKVDTAVKGPAHFSAKLLPQQKTFQDVKTLAFPACRHTVEGTVSAALDSEDAIITLSSKELQPAQAMIFRPLSRIHCKAEIQYFDIQKKQFSTVKEIEIERTKTSLGVGFDPYAPIVISFPENVSNKYRLVLKNQKRIPEFSDFTFTREAVVERYPEKTLAKMFQSPLPPWDFYMWEKESGEGVAVEKVIDISDKLAADGTITWDVPEGEWIIMRTGMTPTGITNSPAPPEGRGLEVDKANRAHAKYHYDNFTGEILRRIPAADRKSFRILVEDSYETGGQNFTDGLIDEFQQRYDYDPTPYLPAMYGYPVGDLDSSDRFLWDLRRLTADKVAYDYVAGLRESANADGLTTWLENYGHWGFPGEFLQYGGQSDEIGGEFWADGDLGSIECRAASSCAHIYGKKTVSCESFTSGADWNRNPASLKRRGDWSFTEGINKTLLHVYIQQPYEDVYPGVDAWFGTEFNRKNIWFSHIDLFTGYLRRCNFMLQQGLNVADVAYFIGEDAPKMTGLRSPEIPKGYSFDYINAEVILRDLKVIDGNLVLPHGTSYRVLVLPPQTTMRPDLLEKIGQLAADGATIIGNPPTTSPSLQNYPDADKMVRELAEKIYLTPSPSPQGRGVIPANTGLEDVFASLGILPDCEIAPTDTVCYVHRTLPEDGEIYFLTNQSNSKIRFTPKFRVKGLQPELWNAIDGSVRPLPAFEQTGEITAVPLQLDINESAFIVFRQKGVPASGNLADNFPQPVTVAELTAPWTVTFNSDSVYRGPRGEVVFNELTDWSQSDDDLIKYYSGAAIYNTTFTLHSSPLAPSSRLFLDLEKVMVMAKVKINGKYAGGVWTYPYTVDITEFVRNGENEVEIEVVNTWRNRIAGDGFLPENEQIVRPRSSSPHLERPLQESGIIGRAKVVAHSF